MKLTLVLEIWFFWSASAWKLPHPLRMSSRSALEVDYARILYESKSFSIRIAQNDDMPAAANFLATQMYDEIPTKARALDLW